VEIGCVLFWVIQLLQFNLCVIIGQRQEPSGVCEEHNLVQMNRLLSEKISGYFGEIQQNPENYKLLTICTVCESVVQCVCVCVCVCVQLADFAS